MQEALLYLRNALQHHVMYRWETILQHLNPQLKPLVKDEDTLSIWGMIYLDGKGALGGISCP